jgi:hypothetical protein
MDGVAMPWEEELHFESYGVRIAERDVERADAILRAISPEARMQMRLAMWDVWTRFVYAHALLDKRFLGEPGRLPAGHDGVGALPALRHALKAVAAGGSGSDAAQQPQAADALDTLMMILHKRQRTRARRAAGRGALAPPRE